MRSDEARRYLEALADEPRPCAFLDLGAFERNAEALFAPCLASGKSLRIATKSLRSVELLERIVALAERAGLATSFMTYSAAETAFLAERGLDDFLLAYPIGTAREADRIAVLVEGRLTFARSVVTFISSLLPFGTFTTSTECAARVNWPPA